ncbi:MAG: hypothetical protein SH820_07840 [Xanthomonadales bacterium]|nr:hypothetical protein [Xanthomonadales bacterium]
MSNSPITDIRHAINARIVVGNDRFRAEAEQRPANGSITSSGPKPKTKFLKEFLL